MRSRWLSWLRRSRRCRSAILSRQAGAHRSLASPAGGGTDIFARTIGQKLGVVWNQQVVVDNRPGAAGMIGNNFVARSAPDGYTLVLSSLDTLSIIPHINKKPL